MLTIKILAHAQPPAAPVQRPSFLLEPQPRIRCRPDDGPISGKAVTERMTSICGCQGRYDCDCVGVENQARRELWSEYNTRPKVIA